MHYDIGLRPLYWESISIADQQCCVQKCTMSTSNECWCVEMLISGRCYKLWVKYMIWRQRPHPLPPFCGYFLPHDGSLASMQRLSEPQCGFSAYIQRHSEPHCGFPASIQRLLHCGCTASIQRFSEPHCGCPASIQRLSEPHCGYPVLIQRL